MAILVPRSSLSYDNFYGIFVGVEKFPNSRGDIPSLMHSNEDADKMCEIFLKERRGAQQKHDLCLLVDKGYPVAYKEAITVRTATRANILRELTRCLKVANANDFLLVYISTHGIIDYDDYFFLPSDGEMDNVLGTGIASSTVVGAIGKATGRGVKALLIIDTCHAGAVSFDIAKYKGEFACLLASSPVEYSYEFFNIEHGVFTEFLIKGLRGEAWKDNKLTLINLYDYVYQNVQKSTHKQQNPLLIGTMKYDTVLISARDSRVANGDSIIQTR
jgi:uncharacterized caspase-like protein